MPDARPSLIKTRAGHLIFLWSFFLPLVCLCVCVQESTSRCTCVCVCAQGAANSDSWPQQQAPCTVHSLPPQLQPVTAQRRNPDSQKICLGTNVCRLVPFEPRPTAVSHMLYSPQVNTFKVWQLNSSSWEKMGSGSVLSSQTKAMGILTSMIYFFTRIPRRNPEDAKTSVIQIHW